MAITIIPLFKPHVAFVNVKVAEGFGLTTICAVVEPIQVPFDPVSV